MLFFMETDYNVLCKQLWVQSIGNHEKGLVKSPLEKVEMFLAKKDSDGGPVHHPFSISLKIDTFWWKMFTTFKDYTIYYIHW